MKKMTMIEKKINSLINDYWVTLDDMFDLVYNLICDCYEDGLTTIKPELIDAAKIAIINCIYDIRDNPKTDPRLGKREWKLKFIQSFVTKTYKHWGKINNRDNTFFLENASSLFSSFKSSQINAFQVLFKVDKDGNENVSKTNKDEMWEIFIDLISIGMEITHLRRIPKQTNEKKIYGKKFIPEIKLREYAKIWKIKLEYYKNI